MAKTRVKAKKAVKRQPAKAKRQPAKKAKRQTAVRTATMPNTPPTLQAPGMVKTHPGRTIIGGFAGNDADGDTLKHTIISGPSEASINQNTGLVTYGPIPWRDLGLQSVVCRVRDNGTPPRFAVATWNVIVEDVPPVFTTTALPTAVQGVPYQCYFHASDVEADTLRWSLEQGPPGSSINAKTGRFKWPNPQPVGTRTVVVRVREKGSQKAHSVQSFEIHVIDAASLDPTPAERLLTSTPTNGEPEGEGTASPLPEAPYEPAGDLGR